MNASTGVLTWASSFVEESTSGDYKYVLRGALIANINKVVSFYVNWTAPTYNGYGKTEFYTPQSTNVSKFIGIADAAIADTATGSVTIKGGIASNGLSSLTPNSVYYVQTDGTINTTSTGTRIGKALSSTSINLEFNS